MLVSTVSARRDTHLLWHNEDFTTCLIDGPRSIVDAQGSQVLVRYRLRSVPALEAQYQTQEPKSNVARARLVASNAATSEQLLVLLNEALSEVHIRYNGPWALGRAFKCEDEIIRSSSEQLYLSSTPRIEVYSHDASLKPVELSTDEWPFFSNRLDELIQLTLIADHRTTFFIPARSTFMLADVTDLTQVRAFHSYIRNQADDQETSWRFNCVIMDPPWSNKSAKRKRSSYKTAPRNDVVNMLLAIDLDVLMTRDCYVGVWITNSQAIRNAVLGDGGLYEAWGVELIEEWVWLKSTIKGEASSPIDAMWRKPYEVFLLGRRQSLPAVDVVKRVLLGVPDVHSRKPCLKTLLETVLDGQPMRVLEVFARHLVSGWWSLGNECIKFNDTQHWKYAT